jgi:hypothetical protein
MWELGAGGGGGVCDGKLEQREGEMYAEKIKRGRMEEREEEERLKNGRRKQGEWKKKLKKKEGRKDEEK